MALFDAAIFDIAIFDTGEAVATLNGGVTRKYRGGRRDLDQLEREQHEREIAKAKAAAQKALRKAVEAAKEEPAPAAPKKARTVLTLRQPLLAAQEEHSRLAIVRAAKETARLAAVEAQVQAELLQQQLDDEAAQAFLAYLMAA